MSIEISTSSANLPTFKESPPFQKKKVHFNYINMNELFLNITAEKYDCILRKNSFILALEPENETVVDQHELMVRYSNFDSSLLRNSLFINKHYVFLISVFTILIFFII